MTFAKGNRYLLTKITSIIRKDPLREKLVGHICELHTFTENEFGWFGVSMEDGEHTVCTSIVKSVRWTDDEELVVTTSNTEYVFAMVEDPSFEKAAKEGAHDARRPVPSA